MSFQLFSTMQDKQISKAKPLSPSHEVILLSEKHPPPPPSPAKKARYVIGSSDRDSCHFTNSNSKVEIKVLPFERPQCLSWNLGLKGWHGPVEVNKHQRENHEKIRWREELFKRWKWRAVEKLQEETGQKNKEFVKLKGLRLKMIEIWFDSHFHPSFLEAHELTRLASFHVFHGLHWEEWSLRWFRCAIYVSFLDSNLPPILHSPESFGESSLWPLVLRNKKNLLEAKKKTHVWGSSVSIMSSPTWHQSCPVIRVSRLWSITVWSIPPVMPSWCSRSCKVKMCTVPPNEHDPKIRGWYM